MGYKCFEAILCINEITTVGKSPPSQKCQMASSLRAVADKGGTTSAPDIHGPTKTELFREESGSNYINTRSRSNLQLSEPMSTYIQDKLAKGEKLTFFITGASGYIGLVVTEFAIAQGHSVRGLSRSEAGAEKLRALGATPILGTITAHDILARESAAADAIIHLAWNHDWSADFNKTVDGDIAAVNAICASIKDTGKPLVIASGGAGAQPNSDGSETDETTPLRPNFFAAKRMQSEVNATAKEGVYGMSIRLSPYVYGRGGKGFLLMQIAKAVELNESLYINDGSYHTSPLHVEDAARLFISAVLKGMAGEAYNGVGQTDVTLKDMAEAIGKLVGVPVRSVTFDEAAEKWTPFLAAFNYLDVRGSNKKAREMLDWKPEGTRYITDITSGSYVPVAAQLKKQKSNAQK